MREGRRRGGPFIAFGGAATRSTHCLKIPLAKAKKSDVSHWDTSVVVYELEPRVPEAKAPPCHRQCACCCSSVWS